MPKPSLTPKSSPTPTCCAGVRAFLPLPLGGYATHWRVGRHPFLPSLIVFVVRDRLQ
jgi:hypothetical protein